MGLGNRSLGAGDIGQCPIKCCLCRIHLSLRRDLVIAQLFYSSELGEFAAGFSDRGLRLQDFRFCRFQGGFRLRYLRFEFGGIQYRQGLADFHLAVVISFNCFDDSGKLTAHIHLVGWLQSACGSDDDGQISTLSFLGLVLHTIR